MEYNHSLIGGSGYNIITLSMDNGNFVINCENQMMGRDKFNIILNGNYNNNNNNNYYLLRVNKLEINGINFTSDQDSKEPLFNLEFITLNKTEILDMDYHEDENTRAIIMGNCLFNNEQREFDAIILDNKHLGYYIELYGLNDPMKELNIHVDLCQIMGGVKMLSTTKI